MMRKFLIFWRLPRRLMVAAKTEKLGDVPPDTIVATVNGQKMTADEVRKMVAGIPAQAPEAFTTDPKQFMKEYAWYHEPAGDC